MSENDKITDEELIEGLTQITKEAQRRGLVKKHEPSTLKIYSVCTRCGYPFKTKQDSDAVTQCPNCGNDKEIKVKWENA